MIQIIYSGTVSEELLKDPDKKELSDQIFGKIQDALEDSTLHFGPFNHAPNCNLPKGVFFFNVVINLIPNEKGDDKPPSAA